MRARVEQPFHLIKKLFQHRQTRYRGLAKNTAQLERLCALANRCIASGPRLSAAGASANVKNAAKSLE